MKLLTLGILQLSGCLPIAVHIPTHNLLDRATGCLSPEHHNHERERERKTERERDIYICVCVCTPLTLNFMCPHQTRDQTLFLDLPSGVFTRHLFRGCWSPSIFLMPSFNFWAQWQLVSATRPTVVAMRSPHGLKTSNRCDKWQLRSIIIAAVRCSFAYAPETYNSHVMCGHVSYLLITYGSQKNGRPFFRRLSNLVMVWVWADDLGKFLVKKKRGKNWGLGTSGTATYRRLVSSH